MRLFPKVRSPTSQALRWWVWVGGSVRRREREIERDREARTYRPLSWRAAARASEEEAEPLLTSRMSGLLAATKGRPEGREESRDAACWRGRGTSEPAV